MTTPLLTSTSAGSGVNSWNTGALTRTSSQNDADFGSLVSQYANEDDSTAAGSTDPSSTDAASDSGTETESRPDVETTDRSEQQATAASTQRRDGNDNANGDANDDGKDDAEASSGHEKKPAVPTKAKPAHAADTVVATAAPAAPVPGQIPLVPAAPTTASTAAASTTKDGVSGVAGASTAATTAAATAAAALPAASPESGAKAAAPVEGKTRDTKQTSTDNLVVVAPAAGQTPAVDAPAAPAPAAAATPAAQLAPHVVLAASSQDVATGGASSVSLQLHPADLGQVNVTVQLHDGIVSVTVQTHDPAGQAAISASLADLHDALSHHGLHPVEVSLTSLGTTAPSAVAVAASPDSSGTNLTGFDAAGQGGANTQDRAQQHSQSAGTQDTDVSGQQDMSGMTARISQPNIPDPSRGLDVRA